jgi:D-serine deaminase-like pyridoxal phosphate-dependent protein
VRWPEGGAAVDRTSPQRRSSRRTRQNRHRDGAPTKAFEPSLFVWATVMSRPAEDRAIVDAGLKALAFDSGRPSSATSPPPPMSAPPTSTAGLGISGATNRLALGDKIRLIPGHCDPTVKPLRLVRLHPKQPRRAALADYRAGGGVLRPVAWRIES